MPEPRGAAFERVSLPEFGAGKQESLWLLYWRISAWQRCCLENS